MIEAILKFTALGVLQGLTEFFPVSSSGHLGLAELLLDVRIGTKQGALVEVALHGGTLLAVLVFLRRDLALLLRTLLNPGGVAPERVREARGLMKGVAIGTVPAALVGILFLEQIEALFHLPWIIGCGFLVSATLLLLSRRLPPGRLSAGELPAGTALLIGCAQMLALVPGISRSGTTIVAALALGVLAAEAGRFSFLLAIPVIGGAAVLKAAELKSIPAEHLIPLLIGVLAAFASGLLALSFLTLLLRRGRLSGFAWYLLPLGLLTLYFAG